MAHESDVSCSRTVLVCASYKRLMRLMRRAQHRHAVWVERPGAESAAVSRRLARYRRLMLAICRQLPVMRESAVGELLRLQAARRARFVLDLALHRERVRLLGEQVAVDRSIGSERLWVSANTLARVWRSTPHPWPIACSRVASWPFAAERAAVGEMTTPTLMLRTAPDVVLIRAPSRDICCAGPRSASAER